MQVWPFASDRQFKLSESSLPLFGSCFVLLATAWGSKSWSSITRAGEWGKSETIQGNACTVPGVCRGPGHVKPSAFPEGVLLASHCLWGGCKGSSNDLCWQSWRQCAALSWRYLAESPAAVSGWVTSAGNDIALPCGWAMLTRPVSAGMQRHTGWQEVLLTLLCTRLWGLRWWRRGVECVRCGRDTPLAALALWEAHWKHSLHSGPLSCCATVTFRDMWLYSPPGFCTNRFYN